MPLRILANENFPREAVLALRERGHDVVWVHDTARGCTDVAVLERAHQEDRLLVTFDKDFGELAYRLGLAAAPGVVLVRAEFSDSAAAARSVVSAL